MNYKNAETLKVITRSRVGVFKPKQYSYDFHLYFAECSQVVKPNSVDEALKSEIWGKAMKEELDPLKRNNAWTLVPKTTTMNVVGNKWVFKVKVNVDGSLQRCKTRLVVKGFHQNAGVDYGETFNPVVKESTMRVILTIAVMEN
ncbi:uncharacterized protein LOC110811530 [Carica papaya]|uniref:uncharacterized protein LOC110811530 n=1 Tax=Carica papaya TaxID=3649 RepID=UPI000B8C7F54|nr:uncharacterized protein LOC110811530 [Carica papaya]